MTRWVLGAFVAGGLVVGIVALIGGPRESLRAINDARALSALPQQPIAPMLQTAAGPPELVVFQDGAEGWFELDHAALPPELHVGFHGIRLIDIFGGGRHVPIYCSGNGRPGKIIWVVEDGQIAQDFAFCNPRRMDLGPLRPFAEPVEMITQQLPRAEVLALIEEIAADPTRAVVATPDAMTHYTQRIVITPPQMWFTPGTPPFQHEVEARIESRLLEHLGDAQITLRPRPQTNPNLSFTDLGASGMVMQDDTGLIILQRVRGAPRDIWIECNPEVCDRLDTFDFGDVFDAGRDLAALRAAMQDAVSLPNERSPVPIDWFPTLSELEQTGVQIAAPVPVTYQMRHITRP